MITFEALKVELRDLDREELERWIEAALVHAEGNPGTWRFQEIDAARIRLILELRHDLEVEEPTLPVVLSLMDQLYDMRRQMRRLNEALSEVPPEIRAALQARLE
jgi:chaperone modulatory protein CbpM